MKYMGSKRWMLRNGLGHLLQEEIAKADRFIDLFSGSSAVVQFAAANAKPIEIVAYDLQHFCVALARAVVGRDSAVDMADLWNAWHKRAVAKLIDWDSWEDANSKCPLLTRGFTKAYVERVRDICGRSAVGSVTLAYGGHYFSLSQALWIDALRQTIPAEEPTQSVSLAALIEAASTCAAAPGHTAQPFAPTRGAKRFLHEAWNRSIVDKTKSSLDRISNLHSKKLGRAIVGSANMATAELIRGDLVFLDPPYSGVHYSRFYHVLETIAQGRCGPVSGAGRYPPTEERPRSSYSVTSEAPSALNDLLKRIAEKEARAILTFPQRQCSNGLSGGLVHEIAAKYFRVRSTFKKSQFSTLGGTKDESGDGYGRRARLKTHELIFTLTPR